MTTERTPVQQRDAVADIDPERVAFEAAKRQAIELSVGELFVGSVALVTWFFLFTGGLLIDTQPYRSDVQNPVAFWPPITSWLIVVLCWTITNVGLLSCVAAYLGALGRRARFTLQTDMERPAIHATDEDHARLATYYLSAILRGFGVYTLILGGILILATSALVSPDQGEYMRLAPAVSIISFYAGYDPSVFSGLLGRVETFLRTKENPGS